MGYKIGMLMLCLIIPALMAVCGNYFSKHPPEKGKSFFEFKTKRAMVNDETWSFAQTHFFNLLFTRGIGTMVISCIAFVGYVLRGEEYAIWIFVVVVLLVEVGSIFILMKMTQEALRDTFDENGERINWSNRT